MKKIIVTGRLGKDPELRSSNTGDKFATFSVAVNNIGKSDKTDWVECSCSGKQAEIVMQYCKKGQTIYLEGSPAVSPYISKEGVASAQLRVYVNHIEMLGSAPNSGTNYNQSTAPVFNAPSPEELVTQSLDKTASLNANVTIKGDDIPF